MKTNLRSLRSTRPLVGPKWYQILILGSALILAACQPALAVPISGAQEEGSDPTQPRGSTTPSLEQKAQTVASDLAKGAAVASQTAAALETHTATGATAAAGTAAAPTNPPAPGSISTQQAPLAIDPSGFVAWCVPQSAPASAKAWPMPGDAILVSLGENGLELIYPARSCTLEFTFNQAVPAGSELHVYELKNNPNVPWLTAALQPGSSPTSAYAVLTHTYITNPPFWKISYRFSVESPDRVNQYWNDTILMKRNWTGRICWNGKMQNPVTLACDTITFGDRHPTDWGYHLPTPTPGGDPSEGYFLK